MQRYGGSSKVPEWGAIGLTACGWDQSLKMSERVASTFQEGEHLSFDPPRFFQTDLESHRFRAEARPHSCSVAFRCSSWNLDFNVCDGYGNIVGCAKIGVGDLASAPAASPCSDQSSKI